MIPSEDAPINFGGRARRQLAERSPGFKAACDLLEQGLWPVPITAWNDPESVSPGKQPIGSAWGEKRPTIDSLMAVYRQNPEAGVGLRLGPEGGVIDIDVDDPSRGLDTLADLWGGEVVLTKGWGSHRGPHYLHRWNDRMAKYKAKLVLDGLEIRLGHGGQFQSVVPPSKSAQGQPRGWNPHTEILPAPESFYRYLDEHGYGPVPEPKPQPTIPIHPPRPDGGDPKRRYALKALENELRELEQASEGTRNEQLNKASFSLGQLAAAGVLTEEEITAGLEDAARRAGLDPKEIAKTIRSGLEAGMEEPRDLGEIGSKSFGNSSKIHFNGQNTPILSIKSNSATKQNLAESKEPEWSEPRLREVIGATEFPLDVFPPRLEMLCLQGVAAHQCPVDYFAAPALALAGACIGMSVNLRVSSSWIVAPNLYLAVVGTPGSGKTPAIRVMSRPLWDIDRQLAWEHKIQRQAYEEEKQVYEASRKRGGGITGPAPIQPIARQLTLDDTTREAFAKVHSENHRGLILILDELSAWVASLNAYRSGRGDDKQFWLKVNSNSLVKVNRKGAPDPITIDHPCATIMGGLTPGMLPSIKGGSEDGWIDRILFAFPEPQTEARQWRQARIDEDCLQDWATSLGHLWAREMVVGIDGHKKAALVSMTPAAERTWAAWFNEHNREVKEEGFPCRLTGPWAKLEGFTLRLALILSQLHQSYGPSATETPRNIEAIDIERAIRLVDYFKVHFRRARAVLSQRYGDASQEAEAILVWIRRNSLTEFSERDVNRYFHRFEKLARLDALLWLQERGCIRSRPPKERPPGQAGRPHSTEYIVNPYIGHVAELDLIDEISD